MNVQAPSLHYLARCEWRPLELCHVVALSRPIMKYETTYKCSHKNVYKVLWEYRRNDYFYQGRKFRKAAQRRWYLSRTSKDM